jgi:hypothetical protein
VLEIGQGQTRRRLFLECEMGTHTIVPESDNKPGATLAKTARYHRFLHGLKEPRTKQTFYRATYPDGLPAELLFLVPRKNRCASVNTALQAWQREEPSDRGRLRVRALTFEEAIADLRGASVRQAAANNPPETALALSPDEVRHLRTFYARVVAPIKQARQAARLSSTAPPDYPESAREVGSLLERLVGAAPGDGTKGRD